jgi:hypothetical protein
MRLDLDKPPRAQFDWELKLDAIAGTLPDGIKARITVPPTMVRRQISARLLVRNETTTDWSIQGELRILYGGRIITTLPMDSRGNTGQVPRAPAGLDMFPSTTNIYWGAIIDGTSGWIIGKKELNCMCDEIQVLTVGRRSFTAGFNLYSFVGCLSEFPV